MKTIDVPARAKTLKSLLKQAEKGGLILRSPNGQEFILAEIDDFDREIELTRRNKQLMSFLVRRARRAGSIAIDEIKEK